MDLANFLTSVLRGNGYNAFCVSGYAPKYIANKDQKHLEPPQEAVVFNDTDPISFEIIDKQDPSNNDILSLNKQNDSSDFDHLEGTGSDNSYKLKVPLEHKSNFTSTASKGDIAALLQAEVENKESTEQPDEKVNMVSVFFNLHISVY